MSDRIAVMNHGVIEQVGDGRAVYDEPGTAFVASFVGENNPFGGKVVRADGARAAVETALGSLQGRNPKGLKAGEGAILFVRPESLRLGKGQPGATFTASVLSVAFEGNSTHVFLRGPTARNITLTVGRHGDVAIPAPGAETAVSYDPDAAIVLPEGRLARE